MIKYKSITNYLEFEHLGQLLIYIKEEIAEQEIKLRHNYIGLLKIKNNDKDNNNNKMMTKMISNNFNEFHLSSIVNNKYFFKFGNNFIRLNSIELTKILVSDYQQLCDKIERLRYKRKNIIKNLIGNSFNLI